MIIATMFGGPRDGHIGGVDKLTPIVFPTLIGDLEAWMTGVGPQPVLSPVTYIPKRDTLWTCPICPNDSHQTITYVVAGWSDVR